jgi:hypothetical protein
MEPLEVCDRPSCTNSRAGTLRRLAEVFRSPLMYDNVTRNYWLYLGHIRLYHNRSYYVRRGFNIKLLSQPFLKILVSG